MAISIRCESCRKRIRVDEAFAGGVCRCPFCKSTNDVPAQAGNGGAARPAAPRPGAPEARPEAPEPPATPGGAQAGRAESIPTANPVRMQGLLAIVGIVLLAVMLVAGVVAAIAVFRGEQGPGPDKDNPITNASGANVLGMDIESPVLYVVDAGGTMVDRYGVIEPVLRHSVRSLDAGSMNLLLWSDYGPEPMAESFVAAGAEADRAATMHLRDMDPAGISAGQRDLSALRGYGAKTVVIFTADAFVDEEQPAALADAADRVIVIAIDAGEEAAATLQAQAAQAGAEFAAFDMDRLDRWQAQAPLLPPIVSEN